MEALLTALLKHEVKFVVVGSVAVQLYGADVAPLDLDIVPFSSWENLSCLARLLEAIEARPMSAPGHWEGEDEGECRWVPDPVTAKWISARQNWDPDPRRPSSLIDSFLTRWGNLDVMLDMAGSYADLVRRASKVQVRECAVAVAHIDDLLATVTVPRRKKDTERVRQLRKLQRHDFGLSGLGDEEYDGHSGAPLL